MSDAAPKRIRRRHVLFFGGFDPKGASWYHAMYKRHAALQSHVNGLAMDVGPRVRDAAGRQSWTVCARNAAGAEVRSVVEVGAWDAVVRRYWPRSSLAVLAQMLAAYARMLWHTPHGVATVARVAPRTLFALCYPLLFFLAGGLLGLLLAAAAAFAASAVAGPAAGAVAFAGVLGAAIFGVLRLERRLDTSLLARIFAFSSRYAVQGVPELDAVIDAGASRIRELLRDPDCDEVLVAGFSVGTILATSAVARALAAGDEPAPAGPAFALLTLGNCIPMLGLFPQAAAYREELARIAASDRLTWVDVSSPTDWGSFPLLDPLEVCRIPLARRGRGAPLMTSPRFHTLFGEERYRAMIPNKHTMHMLYLLSAEKPGRYDWFAITAGAQPLAARYAKARGVRS